MKKLVLLIAVCFSISFVFGQNKNEHFAYKNLLKLSPIDLAQSKFQLNYERYLDENRKNSFLIIPSIYLLEDSRESQLGWEIMGQYRFYLTHLRKDQKRTFLGFHNYGFYAGVYALAMSLDSDFEMERYKNDGTYELNEYRSEVTAQEGGVLIGMQMDITNRIIMDFYVGGGVRNSTTLDTYENETGYSYYGRDGVFSPSFKGVKPKVGFTLGMAF